MKTLCKNKHTAIIQPETHMYKAFIVQLQQSTNSAKSVAAYINICA